MLFVIAIVIAFGTALLWVRIFLRRDKFQPEPRRLLAALFVAGCIVTIPSALIEAAIPVSYLIAATVCAPIVEEGLKLAGVYLICWRSRHFDQVVDGAVYGVSCALGFAAVENLFYALVGGYGLLGVRVLLAPITHPLFTGISGYYLARAKFEDNFALAARGLGAAVLLHAGWNLGPALIHRTGESWYGLVVLLIVPTYLWLLRCFLRRVGNADAQRLRGALSVAPAPPVPAG